jgi:SAM-dependent methyltransferase
MTDAWAGRRQESESLYQANPERYAGEPSAFARWALTVLARFPQHRALVDLGTGVGRDARLFAESGYQVRGVDFAATAIDRALEENRLLREPFRSRVSVVHGEATQFLHLLSDGCVDVVYAHLLYATFTEPELRAAWGEVHRVLRPGGLHLYCVRDTSDPNAGKGELVGPHTYFGGPHRVAYRYFLADDLGALRAGQFEPIEQVRPPQTHLIYAADSRREAGSPSETSPAAASDPPPAGYSKRT